MADENEEVEADRCDEMDPDKRARILAAIERMKKPEPEEPF